MKSLNYLIMKAFYTLLILLIPFVGFGQIPSYVSQDGLVGWWPFNGNSNNTVNNGIDGINYGPLPTTDRNGQENSAFYFDGIDDYILYDASLLPSNERTVSIWFYTENINVGNDEGRSILGYGGDPCGNSWNMTIDNFGNFPLSEDSYEVNSHCNIFSAQASYGSNTPNGSWFNLVISTDENGTKIYENGVLITNTNVYFNNTNVDNKDLIVGSLVGINGIGFLNDINNEPWSGKLDDLAIWNRALSNEEVLQLYNSEDCVDTSYSEITACESYEWNGVTYTESGTYQNLYEPILNASRYYKLTMDSVTGFSHAPRSTEIYFYENNQIVNYEVVELIGPFTGDSFNTLSNCNDIGWMMDPGAEIIFDFTDEVLIDSIVIHSSWTGCCRSGLYSIKNSNNLTSWFNYDSFEFIANGCGWYGFNLENSLIQLTGENGCDSLAVLDLTITQVDTSFIEVAACESFEWNDSTYSQSGTYTYDGVVENNYSNNFSAGDNIIIPNSLELNPTELTISFWVKLNSNSNYNHFVNKWDGDTHQYLISSNNTGIYAYIANDPISGQQSNVLPQLNVWEHIAFTYSSILGEGKIYLNGLVIHSFSSVEIMPSNVPLHIGGNSIVNEAYNTVDGKMDNIEIWNTVLSQQEIQQFIYCPPTGNEEGLVGYWNFEEGEGNTVYDLSGNGNDGTINGATYDTNVPAQFCQLTTNNGCDSVAVLNLTINQLDTSYTTILACDEFTWDGETYTESGEYTNTYTNVNGCDSTHTLNLIINNSISSNTEASSCNSYEWNGMIYENSGTYEFNTLASNGCDSTALLELEICYLDQLEINGPNAAVTSTTSSFSVQDNTGSAFIWSIEGLGTISSGQYTNEIFIDWSEIEGITTICVYEKYDCSGLECLGDTICLEVELKRPAGVVENNLEVNIYPNPSSNIFNLEFNSDSETEISVTNVLGEQVYFESVQSVGEFNTQIDLSNYSKGIYNLTIKNSDGISNHKLILH